MKTGMSTAEVSRRVNALGEWLQNIDLCGVKTAPCHRLGDYPACYWQAFQHSIPTDLAGRSVLDIGCNAGFYCIELKRRGAGRTVGVDSDPHCLAQARLAAELCEVEVEFLQLDVYEVSALRERFDIVLFMGVLYQLRHPLLALDILREHVVSDLLVFQSTLRGSDCTAEFREDYGFDEREHFNQPEYPKLHFVEHRYADDSGTWWIPNKACAEALLRAAGFRIVDNPKSDIYVCRSAPLPQRSRSSLWIRTCVPQSKTLP